MLRLLTPLGVVAALGAAALACAVPAAAASAPTVTKVSPTSSATAGGTRVTVTGTGFAGVTAVDFGAVKGTSVKVVKSTELQVTAPKHAAGGVDVRVLASAGTSPTHTADHYSYVAPPSITKVAPATGGAHGGTRVTITGTGFTGAKTVTFGGTAGTSLTVVKSTELQVTAPAHSSALVGIKVSTAYGSSAGVSADHYVYTGTWTPTTPPEPSPLLVGELNGVSCVTATSCVGVGHAFNENTTEFFPTAATLTSAGWSSTQVLPVPAGAKAGLGVALQSVSCVSPSFCVAVGHDLSSSNGYTLPLIETLSNGMWTASTPSFPNASDGANVNTGLYAVSCTSTTACIAVGSDVSIIRGAHEEPIVETLSDGTWTPSTLPQPAGTEEGLLRGLSCTSATACTAVGYDDDAAGGVFADRLAGGAWTATQLALPSGDTGQLVSVSCASATTCTAVGQSIPNGTHFLPLVETLSGGAWKLTTPKLPAGHALGLLNGVSCTSATVCMAVGYADINTTDETVENQSTLAESLSGGSWTPGTVPVPTGGSIGQSEAVTCFSATACESVGNYFEVQGGNIYYYAASFDGTA